MANIATLIEAIRNAIYGKDVRESIAQGLEAVNTEVESTTAKENNLESQFNSLIINAGNSNSEIVVGRTSTVTGQTYDTIGKRIDGIDGDIAILGANKVDKTQVISPKRHIFGGQLAKLKESLSNPLEQITGIVFIGDSITWGRTLPENGVTDPRDGTLSDPRDLFISPSYVNEFKRYLGANYARSLSPILSNWSASPSGESIAEYTVQQVLYPKGGDFTLTTTGTSASTSEVSTSSSVTGYQYRLAVASTGTGVHEISFNFTGKEFTLAFAATPLNNLDYELFVDGVSKGVFSTTPGVDGIVAGNNNQRTHTFSYVRNKVVKIATKQKGEVGSNYLRLEGIIINKKIRISNQGINGSAARVYKTYNLAGNAFGDGEAVGPEDNYVFVQLGTNDRLIRTDTPKGSNVFKINLKTVIDAITPLANVILMCANPSQDESPATYSFTMQEVRNTIFQLAKSNNFDMIDNYSIFNGQDLSVVLADGLHPNEIGHGIIARNVTNALEIA